MLLTLIGAALSMLWGGREAFSTFGFSFLWSTDWDAVNHKFGALVPIYGTLVTALIAMLIAVPVSFGIALFLTEVAPNWMRSRSAPAIELLAGIPSIIYGMWGLFVFVPFMGEYINPWLNDHIGTLAGDRPAVPRSAARHRHADRRHRARDHGDSVHLVGDARSVPDRADAPEGIGLRARLDDLGSRLGHRAAVHALGRDRRHLPRPRPRARRDDGRHVRARQRAPAHRVAAEPGNSIAATIANEFTEADSDIYRSSLIALGFLLFVVTFIVLAIAKLMLIRLARQEGVK